MERLSVHCGNCGRRFDLRRKAGEIRLRCPHCAGGLTSDAGPPARRFEDPFAGGTVAGCRVRKRLSASRISVSYLATHENLGMPVVLEVFPHDQPGYDEQLIIRLFRALAAASQVRHPNVVRLIDLGRRQGYDFVIWELVDGGSVREALERKGALSVEETLRNASGALKGLAAAHAQGVFHPTLCPDNVLLDYDGSVKLADMGRLLEPEDLAECTVTPGGALTGPCFYAAPERSSGAGAGDARSDLYSLGVVLYEALSGHVPFDGDTAAAIAARHRAGDAPQLHSLRADVPQELSEYVARLMTRNPQDRPADAAAALAELSKLAEGAEKRRKTRQETVADALAPHRRRLQAIGWTFLAILLVILAIIPALRMFGAGDAGRPGAGGAQQRPPNRRLLVLIRPQDGSVGADLSADDRMALLALVADRAALFRPLEPVDPFCTEDMLAAGQSKDKILLETGPAYLLELARLPDAEKQSWELKLTGLTGSRWSARTGVSVESWEGDWPAAFGSALADLFNGSADRLGVAPMDTAALLPKDAARGAEFWRRLVTAVRAERQGRWPEARAALAEGAEGGTPSGVLGVLDAFYAANESWEKGGRTVLQRDVPREGLWGEFIPLAQTLGSMKEGQPQAVRQALAAYLTAMPHSVRAHLLLGIVRAQEHEAPEEVLAPLKRASELDPGYVPAKRAVERLTGGPSK